MSKRLAVVLQALGLTSLTAAGFCISVVAGLIALGASLLLVGVAVERD